MKMRFISRLLVSHPQKIAKRAKGSLASSRSLCFLYFLLLSISGVTLKAQEISVNGHALTGGATTGSSATKPKSKPKPTPTPSAPRDPFWDVSAGAGNGTGGSGTWSSQGQAIWSTTATGDATLVAAATTDPGVFQGTAGTVTISGFNPTLASWTFKTTNYVLTPSTGTTRILSGPFSLDAGVNLNLLEAAQTADREMGIAGSITGGAGSSLTVQGAQTGSGSTARIDLALAGMSIDVPIIISGTGTTSAGFVATATGTGITGAITNNSNFKLLLGATGSNDLTLSSTAVISGTGAVRIGVNNSNNNSGTVTLNAASSYSGGTTLDGGTLVIGDNSALGTGLLNITATSTVAAGSGSRTIANAVTLGGNSTIASGNSLTINGAVTGSGASTRTLTVNNTTTLGGNVFLSESNSNSRTLQLQGSGALIVSGVITNNSGLNTLGSNLTLNGAALTLTLSNTNTYSGTTTLSAGTLILGNKSAFGTSAVGWNGVSTSANTDLSGANAIANTSSLGGNNTFTGTNNIELSGTVTNNNSNNTLTNNISSGMLKFSNTVNLSNNNTGKTLIFNGSGNTLVSGAIGNGGTGVGNLTYSGTGTLTLSGTNTYTGTTSVSGGKLFVNGNSSAATGAVSVSNSGTVLGGSGIIGGMVSFSAGRLAPGATGDGSTAKLTVGALTLNSSSTFSLDLNGTTAGTNYDQLIVSSTGTVTLGNAILNLNSISNLSIGNKLAILDNQSSQTSASMGNFNGLAEGSSFSSGSYTFKIFYDGVASTLAESGGNDIILEVTAVPEPGTWLAGALAVIGVTLTQRKRLTGLFARA
jgi:fibronectin-binding autotransporter adhesin